MSGRISERIIWLLDWCWPFPLGIFASTLALVMAAGIWVALRAPQPHLPGRPVGQTSSAEIPGQSPSSLPSPAQDATPAVPNPAASRTTSPIPTRAEEVTSTAALTRPPVTKPKAQPRPAAPLLSEKQRAEFMDRLTIGRFLVDRKEYSAAIKEFQAALAINPSSREAQAAIQETRRIGKQSESGPSP